MNIDILTHMHAAADPVPPEPGDYISINGRRFECHFIKNGEVYGEAYEEVGANGLDTFVWRGMYRIPVEHWYEYAAMNGAVTGNSRNNQKINT